MAPGTIFEQTGWRADGTEQLNEAALAFARRAQFPEDGINYQQVVFLIAATGVASAYNTYPCNPPVDGNYYDFNLVKVHEATEATYREKLVPPTAARLKADQATAGCDFGFINFGFTATSIDNLYNILALRGTQTSEEAVYDIYNWDDVTQAVLPTQSSGADQGIVKQALWDFYAEGPIGTNYDSLAESCMEAIQATEQAHPGLPWLVCAHSLGGPIANLAAMDATLSGAIPQSPLVITFGSLHLGDATFAANYTATCPATFRMANLSDFVPAMIALEPGVGTTQYVHVGVPVSFVWQTWSDWQNHSILQTYLPTVGYNWNTVQFGALQFPCATLQPATETTA